MIRSFNHPLYIELFPSYEPGMTVVLAKLKAYRRDDEIDWQRRVEGWLSNFDGLRDQRLAFGMLQRLRVVSEQELVTGCSELLESIRSELSPGDRVLHFAHETSGGLLVRLLEKEHKLRSYAVLRPGDFARLGAPGKLRDGDTVVVWDRFNGTGGQLRRLVTLYRGAFKKSGKRVGSLRFAYIAGHPLDKPLPAGVLLHRWIEDIPVVSPEEAALCARYAVAAGKNKTNQNYETGALITFADNPPNNVPLVLRAGPSATWFPMLDRKETARP